MLDLLFLISCTLVAIFVVNNCCLILGIVTALCVLPPLFVPVVCSSFEKARVWRHAPQTFKLSRRTRFSVLVALFVAVIPAACVIWWGIAKPWVAHAIAQRLESLVPQYLGGSPCRIADFDIHLDESGHATFSGEVSIASLPGFRSESIFRVGKLAVEVDAAALALDALWTLGFGPWRIEVTQLIFQAVHVMYEKTWTSSNAEAMLNAMHPEDREEDPDAPYWMIRKINVTDVVLEVTTSLAKSLNIPVAKVVGKDMVVDDFSKEYGALSSHFILHKSVISILANILEQVPRAVKKVRKFVDTPADQKPLQAIGVFRKTWEIVKKATRKATRQAKEYMEEATIYATL